MADKWIQLMSEDGTDNLFPVSKMDLLWENGSPTSSFAAQTISLDLSNYNMVLITASYNPDNVSLIGQSIIKVGNYGAVITVPPSNETGTLYRFVQVNSSGIYFGDGLNAMATGAYAGRAIPYQIYGIK